jgi:hypothetical protein
LEFIVSVSLNTVAADVLSQILDSVNDSDSDSSGDLDPSQLLSQILSSLNTSGGGSCDGLDPSQDDTTSDIDPTSENAPPVSLQDLGLNQFVNPLNAIALSSLDIQPRNQGQSQFVSPGVEQSINPQPLPPGGVEFTERASADDDWCGTPSHFPPPPPGPWADVVNAALSFR